MTAVSPTPEEAAGAVLFKLNAVRTILFTPDIGSRLLLNEDTRLRLAAHLNAVQDRADVLVAALRDARREIERLDGQLAQSRQYEAYRAADYRQAERERDQTRDALATVRAECELPDHIAEIVGAALGGAAEETDG